MSFIMIHRVNWCQHTNKLNSFALRYPLEMHMVHIEDKYIDSKGTYDLNGALGDPMGLAVLAFFFEVDNSKPQVNRKLTFKI